MSLRQTLRHGVLLFAVPALSLAGVIVAASGGRPAMAQPFSADERARAIAEPSVLFIEFTATGVLRDKANGQALHSGTTTVTVRCSGVVVDQGGIAVTDRACVSPDQGQLNYWAKENIGRDQKLSGDALKQFLSQDYLLTGDVSTEPPRRRIAAQGNSTTVRGGAEGAWEAEIVGPAENSQPLAVVRVKQPSLPAIEIHKFDNETDLLTVESTLGVGISPVSAMSLILRSRSVSIMERKADTPKFSFDLEQELPWESRGGAVTDMDGRLIGLLAAKSDKVRALWTTEAIRNQLAAAQVTSQLSDQDKLYREGLDDYFAGRYEQAAEKLDRVALNQLNIVAAQYRDKANQRLADDGGSGDTTLLIIVIVVSTALVLCLILVVALLINSRRKRQQLALVTPTSGYPSAYGSPVGGYTVFNYPVSSPPEQPTSATPYDSTYGLFGGFPEQSSSPPATPPAWPPQQPPGNDPR